MSTITPLFNILLSKSIIQKFPTLTAPLMRFGCNILDNHMVIRNNVLVFPELPSNITSLIADMSGFGSVSVSGEVKGDNVILLVNTIIKTIFTRLATNTGELSFDVKTLALAHLIQNIAISIMEHDNKYIKDQGLWWYEQPKFAKNEYALLNEIIFGVVDKWVLYIHIANDDNQYIINYSVRNFYS